MIKTLFKSVREYLKPSILAGVFVAIEALMECFIPLIMTFLTNLLYVIDDVKMGVVSNVDFMFFTKEISSMDDVKLNLIILAVILIVMAFCSLGAGIASGNFAAKACTGFAKNLREDMYKSISGFSFSNIDKFSSSSLVTRMTTDVTNVQFAYMMIIRTGIRSPLMLIFSMIMAFTLSNKIAWIFVIVLPLLFVGFLAVIYFAMPRFRSVFKKYDKLNNSIQENVSGIRTVKAFVREDYEINKFNKAADEVRKDFTMAEKIVALNSPLMNFAIYTINLCVIYFGTELIVRTNAQEFSTPKLSSIMVYGFQCLMSLMMLSMIIVMVTMAIEGGRRISEVLNEKSSLTNKENPIYEIKDGSVDFENVSFRYSEKAEKYALSNVNIHIDSGKTVGIIGGTGSSKTTFVNLISRLYDTSVGEVKVGGVNVKEYDLDTLRNNVAVVLQKNLLFAGSIKDNLRWGKEDASDEEMIAACKASCADEFVERFPDKYDTHIEQGGANVSGGQKQRLCIARALLKDPKILILDDSTSAVDTKTDAIIRKSFREMIPNTTKIIIAQRVSSIQDADMIIVMENGEINGIGTHEELLKTNDIYQEVYYSQNKLSNEKGGN